MRDKIITAVCRTVEGIEWTTVKAGPDGIETVQKEALPMAIAEYATEEIPSSIELPESAAENIKGDISVPLRISDLFMRVISLPTSDKDEIADMVALQADKIVPFPSEQCAFSHEILQQSEGSSLVLLATARRSCIDSLGDTFQEKGIRIHSIDSRDQGWLQLLTDAGHIGEDTTEIIIINDGIEHTLIVTRNGIPLAFRMLDGDVDDMVYEIKYTLTTLDGEYDLEPPTSIQYWSQGELRESLQTEVAEKSGLDVSCHSLSELPPLSEGIVRRALAGHNRIELIPAEWIEHVKSERLRKKAIRSATIIAGIWLSVLFIFFAIYKTRDIRLSSVKKRAATIAPEAIEALGNREKLKRLKAYTDRADSALECLREATQLLPPGPIEFVSFNYDQKKGVTIRGTAPNDALADDYLVALADSELFEQVASPSIRKRTTKGITLSVFSATLTLPAKEDAQ